MANSFKSEIAPKGLQFNAGDFVVSDKYAVILTVISYPRLIGPGYLSNLTNMSGVKLVIKHIPVEFRVLSKMLNKELSDLKEQNYADLKIFTGIINNIPLIDIEVNTFKKYSILATLIVVFISFQTLVFIHTSILYMLSFLIYFYYKKTNISESEEDYNKARFFAEDVQSIAADCRVDMEISYDEAERAIKH